MIKIQAEHYSQPDIVPITPKGLSVKVLKRRSRYVKGLGLRSSFSVRTTSASIDSDYVRRLEMVTRAKGGNSVTKKGNYNTET
ncbi:hypothetical protein ACSBR1_032201 [Camellia fascicularis]